MHLQKCRPLSLIRAANRVEAQLLSWQTMLQKLEVRWGAVAESCAGRMETSVALMRIGTGLCPAPAMFGLKWITASMRSTALPSLLTPRLLESVCKNLSGVVWKNQSYRKREVWLWRSVFQVSLPLPPKPSVLGKGKYGLVILGSASWRSPADTDVILLRNLCEHQFDIC